MKKNILTLLFLTASVFAFAQYWPTPAPEAKAGARWWWLGSAVDKENLRWNMQQYADKGIGALEITPLYGVQGNDANNIPFLSSQWMEMLKFVEQEGQRDGIQIDMNCGTGWPFGGPLVPLEEAACKMVIVDTLVDVKVADNINLPAPEKERQYAKLVVQRAYPVTDPSKRRVIALYQSRTRQKVKRAAPGGEGYVIDHFDSTAVAHYLQRFEKAFAETQTPYPHTFFNDSYEVYNADWTPTLLDEFAARRGYRLEDCLPQFIDGDPQVVSDYRETLGDLLLKNFTEQWVAWCHSHGVTVRNQAHGSPANLIDVYAAVDIPEIEGFGLSEFGIKGLRTDPGYTRKNYSDLTMLKYAPSAAHITGKKITSSETFTWLTEHFRTSLSQMKPDLDLMFCAGVNHIFFHGICYSPKDDPWPGWKFYASIDMSPTNTIWRDAGYFLKYIERCQSFLQLGQPDNDFLVYLPVRDMWRQDTQKKLMQFDIHAMDQKAPEFIRSILTIDSLGFDCDYISDEYLLTTTYDGKMLRTAAGVEYKAVVIPGDYIMPDNVKKHLNDLAAKGAKIIWGISEIDLKRAAKPEQLKTVARLNIIRRSNPEGYHYFIANLTPNDVDQYLPLAVDFAFAIWFDPMTGKMFADIGENGKIRVRLRSGESMILQTFNEKGTSLESMLYVLGSPNPTIPLAPPIEINKGWTLSFIESAPQVDSQYAIDTLRTWEGLDDTTAHLMGTGVYECDFKLSRKNVKFKNNDWVIDLGDVRESARVYINDVKIGCAWAVPYTLVFPGNLLKKGKNHIRIEVTNLPANRIAQMDREGVKWRKMNEINVVDINYKNTTYDGWAPVPSGLNSKVTIAPIKDGYDF